MTGAVRLVAVSKRYGEVVALPHLDLEVPQSSFFALLGPSGCGKTTTLRLIAGFETADAGEVWIKGDNVTLVPPHKRNFGMVFQQLALFPHLSVNDNVAFGLRMRRTERAEIAKRVARALDLVKLSGYGDRFPVTLLGRAVAVSVMFAGVGVIGALASILASYLVPPPPSAEELTGEVAPDEPSGSRVASQADIAQLRDELSATRSQIAELRELLRAREG